MFHRIIFLLLIVSSLSYNFNRLFSSFMNIACRSTQKCRAYQTLYKITHLITEITKIIIINSLLCWSLTLLKFIQTLDHTDSSHYRNENRLAVWVILEIFWTVSLKAHDWSSWILTECNLSWKIVKYRILSEVCMIKKYETLVYTPPDLLARICKVHLSNAKKFGLTCFKRICFRGLIYCDLECDWRCLLFFGCTYKAINFTLK